MRRFLFVLVLSFAGFAGGQEAPVRVPAPVFRVPYRVVVPYPVVDYSSSVGYYEPPAYGPVYLPAPPRVGRRGYHRGRDWRGGGDEGLGLFGGLLITLGLLLFLVVPH